MAIVKHALRKARKISAYASSDVKRDRQAGAIPEETPAFRAHVQQRTEEFVNTHAHRYPDLSRSALRSSYDTYYVWAYLHPEKPL
jgi:hypothetical protein